MQEQIERDCPVCGRRYDANPTRLKFGRETTCSRACSYKLRASKLENSEQYECGACGKRFVRCRSHFKSRHGLAFCSRECAYSKRQRVVARPYALVSDYDRKRAAQKAWKTRRANAKPYPEAARVKAAARAVERVQHGDRVSKFERKVAEVFRSLGFVVDTSVGARSADGRFVAVFDIVLPLRRIVVECHGDYWHGGRWTWTDADATQTKNITRERGKVALARALGLDMRLLWEREFKKDPRGSCLAVVR